MNPLAMPNAAAIPRDAVFLLKNPQRGLVGKGVQQRLCPGPVSTLDARVHAFFADATEPDVRLVGALPFDRTQQDCLFQPVAWREDFAFPAPSARPLLTPGSIRVHSRREAYADSVRRALALILEGTGPDALRKVVLSRTLTLTAQSAIDPLALAARLAAADSSVETFITPVPPEYPGERRVLVGATPELLVSRRGKTVLSHPLAGSARRGRTPQEDQAAAMALASSAKDLHEHALVVEYILDTLAPLCASLDAPSRPSLRSTTAMWHLGTRITGTLRHAETGSAALAAALHPTPAVAGYPADSASRAIREIEPHRRGFYAGALGWTDRSGDGEWYVALRCAEIAGTRATLYAGAGIVAGSDPDAETAETSAKLQTMLRALGLDEQGAVLADPAS